MGCNSSAVSLVYTNDTSSPTPNDPTVCHNAIVSPVDLGECLLILSRAASSQIPAIQLGKASSSSNRTSPTKRAFEYSARARYEISGVVHTWRRVDTRR
jgi:hypothetical protein